MKQQQAAKDPWEVDFDDKKGKEENLKGYSF